MVGISAGNELLNKAKPENQSHNLIDALNRMHQNLKEEKIFDGTKFMKIRNNISLLQNYEIQIYFKDDI